MLRFLNFDVQMDDGDVLTLEAMASVQRARVPELIAEVRALECTLRDTLPGAPHALDQGGLWDLWVQGQWDLHPTRTLAWGEPADQRGETGPRLADALTESPHAAWWCLTVTLALSTPLQPLLDGPLGLYLGMASD